MPETAKTETPAAEAEPVGNSRRRGGRRSRSGKERLPAEVETAPVVAEAPPAALVTEHSGGAANGKPSRPPVPKASRAVAAVVRARVSEAVEVPPPVAETPRSESAAADEKPAKPKRPARTPRARKPKPGEAAES